RRPRGQFGTPGRRRPALRGQVWHRDRRRRRGHRQYRGRRRTTDLGEAGLAARLGRRDRFQLQLQRAIGRLLSPIRIPGTVGLMRFGLRWRIHGTAAVRRKYRALRRADDGPLLVCANHLTMVDSAIIAWALGSPAWFLVHYAALPWNVPERCNFSGS